MNGSHNTTGTTLFILLTYYGLQRNPKSAANRYCNWSSDHCSGNRNSVSEFGDEKLGQRRRRRVLITFKLKALLGL